MLIVFNVLVAYYAVLLSSYNKTSKKWKDNVLLFIALTLSFESSRQPNESPNGKNLIQDLIRADVVFRVNTDSN